METAMDKVRDRFNFNVKWLPFFLDPGLPEEGVDKMQRYQKKFGSRVPVIIQRMIETGKKEGINFSYGGKIASTLNSHRLIEYADKYGKQDAVVNVLFRNYFEEEKNIGSIDVLTEAAKEAGLDPEKTKEFLKSNEGKDLVAGQVERIRDEYGVDGVPFFIFNNKMTFSGAQEPETFLSVFNKAAL